VVEVATGICDDVQAVRREVCRNRRAASRIAQRVGVRIGAASTHPFSSWEDQQISNKERYLQSVEEMQDAARGNLIFGLHVHVGIEDRELAMAVYNSRATSCRTSCAVLLVAVLRRPPHRAALDAHADLQAAAAHRHPERFQSYAEFESFIDTLVKTKCIDDGRRVWWDIRPHPTYATLEFRVCDLPTLAEDTVTIAAAVQAITQARLAAPQEPHLQPPPRGMIDENKWRAARYGVKGKLIDWGKKEEVPFTQLAEELVEFCSEVVDDLGSRRELEASCASRAPAPPPTASSRSSSEPAAISRRWSTSSSTRPCATSTIAGESLPSPAFTPPSRCRPARPVLFPQTAPARCLLPADSHEGITLG
jgi:carboxylate-amine ligase